MYNQSMGPRLKPIFSKYMKHASIEDGFTLTEVIVAMLILSIVIAMLFSFMNSGLDTYLYGVERMEEQSSLRLTAFRLTEEVRNCFEVDLYNTVGEVTGDTYIHLNNNVLYLSDTAAGTDVALSSPIIDDVSFALTKNADNDRYALSVILTSAEDTITTDILLNNISESDIGANLAGGSIATNVLEILTVPN